MPTLFLCGSLLVFLIWLVTLIKHIGREDLKDTDKIVWMIVLCTLNILGVILYWCMAPSSSPRRAPKPGKHQVRTEAELKEYFNSQTP
ncbi:MAG: PLD nuclease N-terminal domain-containing protein [Chthoniobacterales bacterium]